MGKSLKEWCMEHERQDILARWDKENIEEPEKLSYGSEKKVSWICEFGHRWEASPNKITSKKTSGCPYCANQKVWKGFNDLSTFRPEVAQEWNFEKNKNLTPDQVTVCSNKKVWWKCKNGHEYEASINQRTRKERGEGCPYCANKKLLPGFNDLKTVCPEVAVEWHPFRNGNFRPEDVFASCGKKVWWIGYSFSEETLQQLYEKIKNLISKSYDVIDFSYDLFVSKINSIDSILANQSLAELREKLEKERKKNQKLDDEIDKLQKLKNEATQRTQRIRYIVEKLSKDEYQKVGPTLGKYYNKLVRINDNDGINIVHENGGISLVDDKGKNIVNILSNGQISVFLLAYFFAGINVRNEREKMKIFFIDDLTACMDDVNMLAFIDLLKYQLSSKETMEQLFFVTCDNRISRLIKYKMNGHGIELRELVESDFQ